MTSKILNPKIMLTGLGLTATMLGAAMMASADKAPAAASNAPKAAKSCPSCCMQNHKTGAKAAPARNTAAKKAKPTSGKAAAPKAARATAPVAGAPVAGAGWVYREPGSPMPKSNTTRTVIEPRIQAARDPRNGVSMKLPLTTSSVAKVDGKGKVDFECQTAGHNHEAGKSHN